MLPAFAIVDLAPHHDNTRAPQLCQRLKAGEIAIFDKAYLALGHLWNLTGRGVFETLKAISGLVLKRLSQETPQ